MVPDGDGGSVPDDATRFQLELEFVQLLASAEYLHHIAQSGYLDDDKFLAFLDYLKYWKRPEYARFLRFPHCLGFLDLLTDRENEAFRANLKMSWFRDLVQHQQHLHWMHYAKNRMASPAGLVEGPGGGEGAGASEGAGPAA